MRFQSEEDFCRMVTSELRAQRKLLKAILALLNEKKTDKMDPEKQEDGSL